MKKKRVIILGATGSIGRSTFDVIRNLTHGGHDFTIVGLSCRSRVEECLSYAEEFGVPYVAATAAAPGHQGVTWNGPDAVEKLIAESEADIVVNGIAGSAGLTPSLRVLEKGMDLALANKETVVMAGPIAFERARRSGARILPVDSEHSALFNLLDGREAQTLRRIIITASGGAFRSTPLDRFPFLGVEDALKHPTWDMGVKITIDSATMANKGLEVIEAHRLFDISPDSISVSIHPQSTVHSLVETIEGSLYAQLSAPDMRIPIQNALTYPELAHSPFGELSLEDLTLTFESPDPERYPMLSLAYEAIREEGALPIVYNAANERAVEAFRQKTITFPQIADVVEKTLSEGWRERPQDEVEVMEIHKAAERKADNYISNRKEKT